MPNNYERFLQIQKQIEKKQQIKLTRQKLETRFDNKIIEGWTKLKNHPYTENGEVKSYQEIIQSFSSYIIGNSPKTHLDKIVGMWIAQLYYDNNFEVEFRKKVSGSVIDIVASNGESIRYFIIETEFRRPEKLIQKVLSLRVFPLVLVVPKKAPTLKRLIPTVKSIPSVLKLYDVEVVIAPYFLSDKNLPDGFDVVDFENLPTQEFSDLVTDKEFAELEVLKRRGEQIQQTLNKKKKENQHKIQHLNRELYIEDEIKKRFNYCRIWKYRSEMWKVIQFFSEIPNFSFKAIRKYDISIMLNDRELCLIHPERQRWSASINNGLHRSHTCLSLVESCLESIGVILPDEVKCNLNTGGEKSVEELAKDIGDIVKLNPKSECKNLLNPNLVKNKKSRAELQDIVCELLKIEGLTVEKARYHNLSVKYYGTTILTISQLSKEWSAFFKGERTQRYSKETLVKTVNKIIE